MTTYSESIKEQMVKRLLTPPGTWRSARRRFEFEFQRCSRKSGGRGLLGRPLRHHLGACFRVGCKGSKESCQMDPRLHHHCAKPLEKLNRCQHQGGGSARQRLPEPVFELAVTVIAAEEPLKRERPARAIAGQPLEALPVVLMHVGVGVQRKPVEEGTQPSSTGWLLPQR